jgi:hypothetical protein
MSALQSFVYNLQLSNNLKPGFLTEIKFNVLTNFMKALIFAVPAIWMLYKIYNNKYDKADSFNEYQEKVIEQKKFTNYSQIAQAIMFIFLGIRLYYLYRPTNSELSLAILIKYLHKKNVLGDDIYQFLKNFKPHRIEAFI